MKTVILALVVLLVVSQGEALSCYCGGSKRCSGRTETCRGSDNVCATVSFFRSLDDNFHGCYNEYECKRLNRPGISNCRCCRGDLCTYMYDCDSI